MPSPYGTPPERRTGAVLAPVREFICPGVAYLLGAPLEVGDILRLLLDPVLRVGELVLLLALTLLAATLSAKRAVAGNVSGRLLRASRDLVDDAHGVAVPGLIRPKTRIASGLVSNEEAHRLAREKGVSRWLYALV